MRREEKSLNIKNRILEVTRELLILQGYKVTTIRQITQNAGINTGTLYHFFRDKEDILLHLAILTSRDFMDAAKNIMGAEKDYILRYALIYVLEMKFVEKYDRMAELYLAAYNSWRITKRMLDINTRRNRRIFQKYNENFTDMDFYLRTLALRGIRLSFIDEHVHSGSIDLDKACTFMVRNDLMMFNVPEIEISRAIDKAEKISKSNRLTIQGITV